MRNFSLVTALLACCFSLSYGQSAGITPLHKFFQQYGDSTIIFEYPTDSYDPASYRILSKSNDTVNCFTYYPKDTTYKNFVKYPSGMPKILGLLLSIRKTSFKSMPAHINIFFNLVQLSTDTTRKMWQAISALKPWQLADDKAYPPCPPGKVYAAVVDGPHYILHLITKSGIKTLVYYYPSYYEKEACLGNINRQAVLKIYALFDKYYNKKTN